MTLKAPKDDQIGLRVERGADGSRWWKSGTGEGEQELVLDPCDYVRTVPATQAEYEQQKNGSRLDEITKEVQRSIDRKGNEIEIPVYSKTHLETFSVYLTRPKLGSG